MRSHSTPQGPLLARPNRGAALLICISGFWHAGHELSELCNSVLEDSLSPIWSGEAFAVLTQDLTSHLCVDLLFVSPLSGRSPWAWCPGYSPSAPPHCLPDSRARSSSPMIRFSPTFLSSRSSAQRPSFPGPSPGAFRRWPCQPSKRTEGIELGARESRRVESSNSVITRSEQDVQ